MDPLNNSLINDVIFKIQNKMVQHYLSGNFEAESWADTKSGICLFKATFFVMKNGRLLLKSSLSLSKAMRDGASRWGKLGEERMKKKKRKKQTINHAQQTNDKV